MLALAGSPPQLTAIVPDPLGQGGQRVSRGQRSTDDCSNYLKGEETLPRGSETAPTLLFAGEHAVL